MPSRVWEIRRVHARIKYLIGYKDSGSGVQRTALTKIKAIANPLFRFIRFTLGGNGQGLYDCPDRSAVWSCFWAIALFD